VKDSATKGDGFAATSLVIRTIRAAWSGSPLLAGRRISRPKSVSSVGLQPARVKPCSISHVKRSHSNTGSAVTMPTCCTSFVDADGSQQFGKWIFEPVGGVQGLAGDEAKAQGPGFLLDDLRERVKQSTVASSFNPAHPAASAHDFGGWQPRIALPRFGLGFGFGQRSVVSRGRRFPGLTHPHCSAQGAHGNP
jgi:hypothetical protein